MKFCFFKLKKCGVNGRKGKKKPFQSELLYGPTKVTCEDILKGKDTILKVRNDCSYNILVKFLKRYSTSFIKMTHRVP